MATNTWTGAAGDNNFSDGSNWSLGTAPGVDATSDDEDVVITLAGAAPVLDGAVTQMDSLTIGSSVDLFTQDNAFIEIDGSISNNGLIDLFNSALAVDKNTSLSGTGTIFVDGGQISDNGGSAVTLDNSSTIAGTGDIFSTSHGFLSLTNDLGGAIEAEEGVGGSSDDVLTIATDNTVENQGLLAAEMGALLSIDDNVDQTAPFGNLSGTIRADGSGAYVTLSDVSITGGTLATSGGGYISVGDGGSASTYASFIGLTVAGVVSVSDGDQLILSGSIGDTGEIDLYGGGTTGSEIEIDGDVNLSGTGVVDLLDGAARIVGATGGDELDTYATIEGFGGIGDGTMVLFNGGLIDADVKKQTLTLALNGTDQTESANGGTIEAKGGGIVAIGSGDPNGSDFQNNGTIAAYAYSAVTMNQITLTNIEGGVLDGGTWIASGKGAVLTLPDTIDDLDAAVILNGGGSYIKEDSGSGTVNLEATLNYIDTNGELEVLGGRNFYASFSGGFDIEGRLQLGGGVFENKSLDIEGTIAGYGTVTSADMDGEEATFYASGGTLKIGSCYFDDTTFAGTGTIELTGKSQFDTDPHNHLTVANLTLNAADIEDASALTYAKTFLETGNSTIDFDGGSLTLSSKSTLTGGTVTGSGTLALNGTTTSTGFTVSGGATVTVGAATTLTGTVTLGSDPGGKPTTGTVGVAKGGTLSLSGAGGIVAAAGSTDRVNNSGTIAKTGGGISTLGATTYNVGTIAVSKGTLDVTATVSGKGNAIIQNAGMLEFDGVVGAQAVTFGSGGGTLRLEDAPKFAGSVAKLGAGDTIDVGHFGAGTTFTYVANAQKTGGTLTLKNGGVSAKIALVGSYAASGFHLATGKSGDTLVTYSTPKAETEAAAPETSSAHTGAFARSLFEGAFGGAPAGDAAWHVADATPPAQIAASHAAMGLHLRG